MTDKKISDMIAADPLTGADIIPVLQGGNNRRATLDALPYLPAGTGAVATTVQGKLREQVSLLDFKNAAAIAGDWTTALAAALDYVKARSGALFIPSGTYVVTSGYTQSTTGSDILIYGEGSTRENARGSHIQLSSTDPASFFYKQNARHHLQVRDITFSCAQYVLDRKFFVFAAGGAYFKYANVNFESVEKPIYFDTNCYFQNAALENVQFRGSGTIHSAGASPLKGTLLLLDNVNHETSVPINTEKIVCDLSGVRSIKAVNFLLEGSLPAAGWTVLKLSNGVIGQNFGEMGGHFENYWSEWPITAPENALLINGMSVKVYSPYIDNGAIRLQNNAFLVLEGVNQRQDEASIDSAMVFEDTLSRVIFQNALLRNSSYALTNSSQVIVRDSEVVWSGAANDAVKCYPLSSSHSEVLYEWQGGLMRSTTRVNLLADNAYSSLRSIETNATYGRLIRINRNGENYPRLGWQVKITPEMWGKPVTLSLLARFPDRIGGTYLQMYADWDGGVWGGLAGLGAISTGSYLWSKWTVQIPSGTTFVGFQPGTNSDVVAEDLTIAAVRFTVGMDIPVNILPNYPTATISYNTAAPTTGTWAAGDIVYNSAPAAATTPGWVCVTAGSPGTWKAMANLAA